MGLIIRLANGYMMKPIEKTTEISSAPPKKVEFKLRDYQRRAIDSLGEYWREKKGKHPIIVAGTGAGKSVIQGFFIKEAIEAWPATRILCLTHVKELIGQNFLRIDGIWQEAPIGIYSAGLKKRENTQVLFAGIQSIHKKAFDFDGFDLIIIDECHLLPKKGAGMYRTFLQNALMVNPKIKVVGLTASPFRLDGGSLIDGEGAFFDGLACHITVKELIEKGHLTPLTAREGIHHIETKNLSTQNGEYKADDQVKAFHEDDLTGKCIEEIMDLGKERKSWMIFCAKVDHCEEVAERLNDLGIVTQAVHGGLTAEERASAIDNFDKQITRCLVSVNILTTGFDVSHVHMIVLMRSTQSASLYLQICGRGMRLHEGKEDCLVLDYGENILNHGAIDEIVERQLAMGGKKKGKKGQAVMKRCEHCDTLNYAAARQCVHCDAFFPIDSLPNIQQEAARLAILSSERGEVEAEWHDVLDIDYRIHKKIGKPDSLRVDYYVSLTDCFSEWICFDHGGFATSKAQEWIRTRSIGSPEGITTETAYSLAINKWLAKPLKIKIQKKGKYHEIKDYRF